MQAVKLKLLFGNNAIASQLPTGAVISGDHGLQAFRGYNMHPKLYLYHSSGMPGAFFLYSSAYYKCSTKSLSQRTPANASVMPVV